MTRIAFLGLGHMGLPMARNLVAAGHEVHGFDLVPAVIEAAGAAGIPIASSGADAATDADAVITMFPAGRHVLDAYQDGLLAAARPGTLFIESSTIAVHEAQAAHGLAVEAGHRNVDAPVSGGVVGAENGTLAFMVGGSEEDFAVALPLLEVMGKRIVHCGGPGLGQAAKVCNNMVLAVSQIAVAEAFVLGERLGLEHQALFDVVSQASGQCWSLTTNCPVPGPVPTSPANRNYQPGFAGALMAKDLGLALQAIEQTSTDAKMGRLAQELYAAFAAGDGAGRDFSGIITDIRDGRV
ncbi:3-hydroxyisobutyrate dehydrogenase [Microbacterium aerolatum]|uniref:3-hydroxyisobutyrate dehydrogenase n=1 Tax=Microbacterium aerolatum TaxID=153731 RepID=A0A511ACJ0_9MICO|nr:3-hydroxyisobutyrate dehydrogenase [Microbacterium aerolatum]GEK85888.1 3-hydroxyisobutyrate dehydrogenase [Microbacterium aerolatum]GGB19426.1 3-hydroxyisobutyrate dehydrogenase [Microbacterium aerolatum]